MYRIAGIIALALLITPSLAPLLRSSTEQCCDCLTQPCCCQGLCPIPGLGEKQTAQNGCSYKDGCSPAERDFLLVIQIWIGNLEVNALSMPESRIPAFSPIHPLHRTPTPPKPPPRFI